VDYKVEYSDKGGLVGKRSKLLNVADLVYKAYQYPLHAFNSLFLNY